MFSGNPLILILGILSFVIFFSMLGIKASKKQLQTNPETKRHSKKQHKTQFEIITKKRRAWSAVKGC